VKTSQDIPFYSFREVQGEKRFSGGPGSNTLLRTQLLTLHSLLDLPIEERKNLRGYNETMGDPEALPVKPRKRRGLASGKGLATGRWMEEVNNMPWHIAPADRSWNPTASIVTGYCAYSQICLATSCRRFPYGLLA
jgi:hypothetical protein